MSTIKRYGLFYRKYIDISETSNAICFADADVPSSVLSPTTENSVALFVNESDNDLYAKYQDTSVVELIDGNVKTNTSEE